MTKAAEFEIADDYEEEKSGGHFFTTFQIIFIACVGACLILFVGLMCGLLPQTTCETNNVTTPTPTELDPSKPPVTKAPTEPPVTEPSGTTISPTTIVEPWDGRLPRDIIPESYDLYLKPFLYEDDVGDDDRIFTFDGRVTIHMRCDVETNVVTLHLRNITLHSYTLKDADNDTVVGIASVENVFRYDFVQFNLDTMLEAGKGYVLEIAYLGELWAGLSGFYRSSYKEGNETKWLATTQMQPTSARRALPCFDEPDLKAVFNTKIEHRDDMVALSNGIETAEESTTDGWLITSYEATPKMSTYLLAFVVGYFDYSETETENGVRLRVWARPEAVNSTLYALEIGSKITTYFEEYFATPFPLEKQDMIAVPDFAAGAMENWGLIIYRETALLYDSMVNSASNKQYVAIVVSHELAHMWFGNLVTCAWWDDLWLNEGFASYVEGLGVDYSEPNWGMKEQFVDDHLQPVFNVDALGTSHPLKVPVNSPAEINAIFDSITYSKGASVIRMLNDILSEAVFVSGLKGYISKYSEANANTDDLWEALTEADIGIGDHDVKEIMDTWTLQMGFPVVDIHRIEGNKVNASQEHFLVNPDAGVEDKYGDVGYLWYVSLTFAHETNADFDMTQSVRINKEPWAVFNISASIGADEWFLANIKQYGFYRVNYDNENWARLSQQLVENHKVLPNENRGQLINDAFTLARVGRVDYPIALNLTLYMDNEMDYVPWESLLSVIFYITDMFSRHPGYGPLERYMREQIQVLYDTLGWEDQPETDPHLEQFNRVNAIGTSCRYRNQDCLDQASYLFQQYMMNDANNNDTAPDYEINPITPNLKTTVYCYGIQEGGQEEWNFGWKKYVETNDAAEKSKWLFALSYSQAPWILSRYLEYSLNTDYVRSQDSSYVIIYVSRNYIGRSIAWDFLRTEWDTYKEYYGGSSFAFSNIITGITEDFNTEMELEEVIAFGEGRNFGSATRAYEQAIEVIQTNIAWMEDNSDTVADWFQGAAPKVAE